eukprot:5111015-Pleurochrysis_carterae.AAC.2
MLGDAGQLGTRKLGIVRTYKDSACCCRPVRACSSRACGRACVGRRGGAAAVATARRSLIQLARRI